jgi:hypothetical protein
MSRPVDEDETNSGLAASRQSPSDHESTPLIQRQHPGMDDEDDSAISPLATTQTRRRNLFRPVKRVYRVVINWTAGPDPPRIYHINPIFPRIQHAPIQLVRRFAPKKRQKFILLVAFYFLWLLAFATLLHKSQFQSEIPGYGAPALIGCLGTFWYAPKTL